MQKMACKRKKKRLGNTSGGTISGNLAVQGNLTVTGETTTEKQKELEVEDMQVMLL